MAGEAQRVVHVKKDHFDTYIGRGSKWGNPYRIGDPHHGRSRGGPMTRREVLELFTEYIVRGEGRPLLRDLGELEGRTLGCFCAPHGGVYEHDPLVCHGQILLKLLSWRRKKLAQKRVEDRADTGGPAG